MPLKRPPPYERHRREGGAERDEPSCAYCGQPMRAASPPAKCAVCGMGISEDHFPRIVRVEPNEPPVGFCSVACMDNYDAFQEAADDE